MKKKVLFKSAERVLRAGLAVVFAASMMLGQAPIATAATSSDTTTSGGAVQSAPSSQPASPTVVKELTGKRTAEGSSYLLSNGEIESQYSMGDPVNYLDPKTKTYLPIDTGLADQTIAGRSISANRANRFHLRIPHNLANDWVSVGSAEGTVSMRPVTSGLAHDAQATSGTVLASEPTTSARDYANAFTGASLAYESRSDGLKESIVLSAPTSSSVFSFSLSTDGLTPKVESDGSIDLFSAGETTPTYTIPRPYMFDSSTPHDENSMSDQVHYVLSGSASPYRLDVIADATWLSDPSRVYPIKIDPSVKETNDSPYITFINGNKSTTNYYGQADMWVGNANSQSGGYQFGEWHTDSTFDTDLTNYLNNGYQITSAVAQTYAQDHYGWGNVYAQGESTYYIPSTVTYGNLTRATYNTEGSTNVSANGYYNFNTTDIEKSWQASPGMFKAIQFYCASGVKVDFATTSSQKLYTRWAGTPTVSLKPPYVSGTPSITIPGQGVSWNYAEGLTSFPQAEYQIQVATSSAGPAVASSDVSSAATGDVLPTPSGGWNYGQTYYVRVAVASDPDNTYTPRLWSAWTAWTAFKPVSPDTTPPTTTSNAQASYNNTATIALSATDNTGGSGVANTYYRIDGSGTTSGTTITIAPPTSGVATHTVNFWSVDNAGNVETTKSATFTVTRTPPTITTPAVATQGIFPFNPQASWTLSQACGDHQVEYQAAVSTSPVGPASVTTDVASTSSLANLPAPTGGWQVGQAYYVQVRAASAPQSGGPATWSAWSTWVQFYWNPSTPSLTLTCPSVGNSAFTTPTASWSYSESWGNPQVEYQAQVSTSTGGPAIASSDAIGTATSTVLPVPAGGWQLGQTYYAQVRVASSPVMGDSVVWSTWTTPTAFSYLVPPSAVGTVSATTTASAGWFTEADTNGDGVNDLKDDSNAGGRGSVALSWPAAANATSYNIYLFDGVKYDKVDSSTMAGWTSAGRGVCASDTAISNLTTGTGADPYPTNNFGRDLRDDPRPLYSKMTGQVTNLDPHYYFKVTAVNALGETAVSSAATTQVTLQDRTVRVADDPQHAAYDLGTNFLRHSAQADLERGSLELDVTDLKIASWGPAAELSRHYSSARASATSYAPGWRFNFEQSLTASGTTMLYADETGDVHRFTNRGGTWTPPNGLEATLGYSSGIWTLTFKDRSVATFDSNGRLLSAADADGNKVTYVWTSGHLYITAANGQFIDVSMPVLNVVTQASYTTGAGTRTVTYDDGAGYSPGETSTSVRYFPNDTDMYEAHYTYGENGAPATALTSIECPEYPWTAIQKFGFDGSAHLSSWQFSQGTYGYQYALNSITYPQAGQATVSKHYGVTAPGATANQTVSFNSNGTIASKTSLIGPGSWAWVYGPTNSEIFSSTPNGHTVTSVLDSRDNVLSATDELGHTTTYAYDSLDRETCQTNPLGATDVKAYTGPDLTSETKSLTSTQSAYTEWDHNASGTVTEQRQRIDATTTARTDYQDFALNGLPQTTINRGVLLSANSTATPLDLSSTARYDSFGNETSATDAAGDVTLSDTYSTSGRVLTSTTASGAVTSYTYDALGGERTRMTTAPGGLSANCVAELHNPAGAMEWTAQLTDANWDDQAEQLQAIPDLSGQPYQTYHYDASLNMTGFDYALRDAEGNVTQDWATSNNSWQPADSLSTRTTYDAEGRAVSVTLPGGNPTVTTYSPGGLVTRVDNADGSWETRTYDAAGDPVTDTKSKADNTGATTKSSYDLGGRVASSTDENGNETDYSYDAAGHQLTAGIQGHPSSTSTYNTLGWVLSTTDADGIVTKTTYDNAGRVTLTDVSGKQTTFAYDAAGDLVSQTDPTGATVADTYDVFGRKIEEKHSQGTTTLKDTVTTYDYASRVTGVTRTAGAGVSEADTYSMGLLAGSTLGYGATTSTVSYDAGNVTEHSRAVTATDAAAFTRTVNAYDAAKRATDTSVTGGLSMSVHREFDGGGHQKTQSGTGLSAPAAYTYADDGRKSHETLPFSLGGSIDASYTYTPDGRLNAVCGSGAGAFGYDSAGDLTTYTATVDGSGATTSGVLAYDSAGRLAAVTTTDGVTPLAMFGFDTADGWRTSEKRSGESSVTYGYDNAGRLNLYTKPAGSLGITPAVGATYSYDAMGQRSQSVVTSGSVTTTTTWTYDGLQLDALSAARSDGATWSVTYLYDQEARPFAGVYRSSSSNPTEFGIVTTDRGDVAELTDSSGSAFAAYRYDAWGRPLAIANQGTAAVPSGLAADIANRQVLRYAGYAFDAESGLYYCSARTYDPSTMQFLQKDPAKADGAQSAYQYCENDPVGRTDPTGRITGIEEMIVVGAFVALCAATIAWLATPAQKREQWIQYVSGEIWAAMHSRPPGWRYRWELVEHHPHFPMPSLGGGRERIAVWILTHPDYREHHHLDVYDNETGRKVWHSPGF